MTLDERVSRMQDTFSKLVSTNSRTEKQFIVNNIPGELKEDFEYVLECLSGKYMFGFTYNKYSDEYDERLSGMTIKQLLTFLQTPYINKDLSRDNIKLYTDGTQRWASFIAPIVNRTLRLGIGNSLLDVSSLSPMLAKKYEGTVKYDKEGYYLTEKLDGNRCIASYNGGKWNFTSRNGKVMHVNFDMDGFDKSMIYDGEILSPEQVEMSKVICEKIKGTYYGNKAFDEMFSKTSGLINRHTTDKKLIYNVFDIVDTNSSYADRRATLDKIKCNDDSTRIVKVLKHYKTINDMEDIWKTLSLVTDTGGEGLMINLGSSRYLQKRTDQLLKLKKVYTIDMEVYGIIPGTGKYEFAVGSLEATCKTDDGKNVFCSIGTGLSDQQRFDWYEHPEKIVNKIVEVSYFSISQTAEDRSYNNNIYSLRFPRLKSVREDKNTTSEY